MVGSYVGENELFEQQYLSGEIEASMGSGGRQMGHHHASSDLATLQM